MRQRRVFTLMLIMVVTGLVLGCSAKSALSTVPQETVAVEREVMREAEASAPQAEASYAGDAAAKAESWNAGRMIIQTVNMSVVVEDTDATLASLRALVKDFEGYFADSNRHLVSGQAYATVTVRIPAASLDAVLERIRGLVIAVENENLSGQDVTEEFVDLQARLRNLEATEKELQVLLTEVRENRGKAEDILAVHRELTNIRSQIESLKGRSQYLERMTALATVHLDIRPKAAPQPLVEKARWNPLVTINRALRGFVQAFEVLADLIIYILIFSPFILVPIILLWLLVRGMRRRAAKKKAAKSAPPDEA